QEANLSMEPLMRLAELRPAIELAEARIEANLGHIELPQLCASWLKVAAVSGPLGKGVAARVQQLPAVMADKGVARMANRLKIG
ncbi:MAG: hypothetical protein WBV82_21085, partial [Myxococcaceae bacterium]